MKKRFFSLLVLTALLLSGCGSEKAPPANIAATTLPVYELTAMLCENTGLTVTRLVTESVSCLHDYSLNVDQVRAVEAAEIVVISGAGLEEFMVDVIAGKSCIDASEHIEFLEGACHDHDHGHDDHGHTHAHDPHIWLSPRNAITMAGNICAGLSARYPDYGNVFQENLENITNKLNDLQQYGQQELSNLNCRELITFHDGFDYFAESFDLTILKAVEEESGSEASAADLKELINLVNSHALPAVFTEALGSTSAARIIATETGAKIYTLDMAMHGNSYLEAMYHNISVIKEALG